MLELIPISLKIRFSGNFEQFVLSLQEIHFRKVSVQLATRLQVPAAIVKILEVASYSNLKQLQGSVMRDDELFELHLVDLSGVNDGSCRCRRCSSHTSRFELKGDS